MSSDEVSIHVANLSKRFEMYAQPVDRLKQMVLPKAQRLLHRKPREYFREFWALRDVNFEVRKGETMGIVGRNGSGKSTLLQLICGTLTPTAGTINVRGRVAALLELGSGFNPEFTGRENVYLNAAVLGLTREEIDKRFDAIEAFADIGDFIDQPVKTYSSGMQVRLAFAVAINVDPEILVVDEALSVGDELFQRKCFARIETIRDNGATILFVSHAAGAVVDLCDRALLVDAGELLSAGTPKLIVSRYHKLLYAPSSDAATIRQEIRQAERIVHADEEASRGGAAGNDAGAVEGTGRALREEETYDPALVPSSRLEFAAKGARIGEPVLRTLGDRQVNGLVRGRRYRYRFDVTFSKVLYYVRFGMLIKSITGLPICGTMSVPRTMDGRSVVESGQVASVEYEFDCMLNPGVYFMNAGVFGVEELGHPETLLHRIVDAICFRVLPIVKNTSTELIDFNCESQVQFGG
jgi:lipopolysaccharide transport system ATP-binding protein